MGGREVGQVDIVSAVEMSQGLQSFAGQAGEHVIVQIKTAKTDQWLEGSLINVGYTIVTKVTASHTHTDIHRHRNTHSHSLFIAKDVIGSVWWNTDMIWS